MRGHLYLVVIILLATIATLMTTALTYRNALRAARDSLELQAIGMAVSLEASLSTGIDGKNHLLREIITAGMGEGIAYAALYSGEGVTLLHSNENLIGRRIRDVSVGRVAATGLPSSFFSVLGTQEKVFTLDFPVHIQGEQEQTAVLRLVLHPYPAEGIVRQVRFQMIITAAVLFILWVMGLFIIRAVRKSEELKMMMAERERLAVIGEMASVLAHEIRNPLGSIKGFAQYLKEQKGDLSQRVSYMDIIISESERLETLTEDLLSYARSPEVKKETFPLHELLEEALMMAHRPSEGQGPEIEISIPHGLKISSDRERLRAVLENLIRNASDAVAVGGKIEVTAGTTPAGVQIVVKDDGCGMDRETQKKVFDPFFTTKTRGTGLGLAIVKKIIRSLQGSITIDSKPGRGTSCTITLPQKERAEERKYGSAEGQKD